MLALKYSYKSASQITYPLFEETTGPAHREQRQINHKPAVFIAVKMKTIEGICWW